MNRLAAGFSLVENVFSALIIAGVILGMSTVISTYSIAQSRTRDRPYAVNLAQQQIDEITMNLATHNSMVYDNATPPRGRSYYLEGENVIVTWFYFNNFPMGANPDPIVGGDMAVLPWDTSGGPTSPRLPSNIGSLTYAVPIVGKTTPYIQNTMFYRNRYYTAGGNVVGGDLTNPTTYPDLTAVKAAATSADPAKFAVRIQLFGIPGASASDPLLNIGDIIRNANAIAPSAYTLDPRIPPGCTNPETCGAASSPFLVGDSCISGTDNLNGSNGATGRVYLRERTSIGPDRPYYFQHYSAKVFVSRVYKIDDFTDDGTFYSGTGKPDQELASGSVVLFGRAMRQ